MQQRGAERAIGILAAGSREAESVLMKEVEVALAAARADLRQLSRPLRVVVPSASLRRHVSMRVVERLGRSSLGIQVTTHRGLAVELLERAGVWIRDGQTLLPTLVQRALREEPELERRVGALRDGHRIVEASVQDLFDAGFEEVHEDALAERLEAFGAGEAGVRARCLLRIARRVALELGRLGLETRAGVFKRAVECLERDPALLPARTVWLYGFADVTGVTFDWLRALCLHAGARALLSRPPDPAATERYEEAFTAPLVERLGGLGRWERANRSGPASCGYRLVSAPGAQAEARAVAEAVRTELDAGTPPERIAIVARDLTALDAALATQLERLGVPYTAPSSMLRAGHGARAASALVALLRRGEDTPIEHWLDAGAQPAASGRRARTTLLSLGLVRIGDLVAGHDPALATLRHPATRILARLGEWPATAPTAEHFERLHLLLTKDLRWEEPEALAALRAELPEWFALTFPEFVELVGDRLTGVGTGNRGGNGAGVQVLTIMEARGLTFERLFVVGMNRGAFPRPAREDPLLPDALRASIRELLPEFPIKGRARDEERHLFAELSSATPLAVLSWQTCDEEGRARSLSPLVVRLRSLQPVPTHEVPSDPSFPGAVPRPAHEHLLQAALERPDEVDAELFAVALEEAHCAAGDAHPGPIDTGRLAAARVAVLAELAGRRADRDRLHPGPTSASSGAGPRQRTPRRPRRRSPSWRHWPRVPGRRCWSGSFALATPTIPASSFPTRPRATSERWSIACSIGSRARRLRIPPPRCRRRWNGRRFRSAGRDTT